MEIVEERRSVRKDIIDKAAGWASGLRFKATAILVGSYARGDFNLWSDIDILLVSEEFKGSPLKRLEMLDAPPGFQVIPLTPKEFKTLLERREGLVAEAIRVGVALRDDFKLFNDAGIKRFNR